MVTQKLFFLAFACMFVPVVARHADPNIVFLVVESTGGRTWQRDYQDGVIPLPHIRSLQDQGTSFYRHYSNTPVCCASRATFWSGRHAHKVRHETQIKGVNFTVDGAWNNFEGLSPTYDKRIDQVLGASGKYATLMTGKMDWTAGSHSENVQLSAWTKYVRFPYNVPKTGGWVVEKDVCASNGTVQTGTKSAHEGDWNALREATSWIQNHTLSSKKPFFVYQGMDIVHPPYKTNEEYYKKIDPAKIRVPDWLPLEKMHPCDFQSTMRKGCAPSVNDSDAFYDVARRRNIRRIYYAMIAEFDAMVGAYIETVKKAGVWDNTVFIVTSDHGDMQMEHQQHYKMVPREASSSVPMVIMDGRLPASPPKVVTTPTQLIDIYPTVMELAGIPLELQQPGLDGYSLLPLLTNTPGSNTNTRIVNMSDESVSASLSGRLDSAGGGRSERPPYIVSQFHGVEIAMSWFMIVQVVPAGLRGIRGGTYKLIVWGTGHEVVNQLFELVSDPDENVNLLSGTPNAAVLSLEALLLENLHATVDYPSVAMDVAAYNRKSFLAWANATQDWQDAMHQKGLRWDSSWDYDPKGAAKAMADFLEQSPAVLPCLSNLVYEVPSN